jgi:hypothetical protein
MSLDTNRADAFAAPPNLYIRISERVRLHRGHAARPTPQAPNRRRPHPFRPSWPVSSKDSSQ